MIWKLGSLIGKIIRPLENLFLPKNKLSEFERKQKTERLQGCSLYHFQLSPYSFRVRKALAQSGAAIPMRDTLECDIAYGELMAGGKRDRVPCLRIEAPGKPTEWLYESKDIVAYLDQRLNKNA
jgi:hypothetical protein